MEEWRLEIEKIAEIIGDNYIKHYTRRIVTFRIEDDKLEIYFQLSEEERDLLDEYMFDEIYFDDNAEPSYLVLRFRKR